MLPASSAFVDENRSFTSSDDAKQDQDDMDDDLSLFDAHSWALDHLKVEIKDEPKDEIVTNDTSDVEEWRSTREGSPCSIKEEQSQEQSEETILPDKEEPRRSRRKGKPKTKGRPRKKKEQSGQDAAVGGKPRWRVERRRHNNELWVTVITNHTRQKKSFACQQCSKVCTTKGNLNNHMRCHSGEQPFVCQVCGRRFSFNCNLNTHLLKHSGTKPFKCDVCEKSFVTKGNLRTHSRTHTGEKPFECPHCQKGFSVKDNLSRHLKVHKEKEEAS